MAFPHHVLVLVLQHVKPAERLKSCALVSRAWAEAAAQATDAVRSCTYNLADLASFKPWLEHHGVHVTSLFWSYNGRWNHGMQVLSTLPCRNLQQLCLFNWAVQLEGRQSLLQAATGLTYLDLHVYYQSDFLDHRGTYGGLQKLTALQKLSALQRFELSVGEASDVEDYNHQHFAVSSEEDMVPSAVIDALSTSLTRLSFSGVLALESFNPLSRLVKLQHLYMNLPLGVQEDTAQAAQQPFKQLQALTFLSLCMEEPRLARTSSTPPLSGCAGLQELHLYSPSLDAASFEGLTGLRRLYMMVPEVLTGGAAGFASVLSRIGCMPHLERLVVAAGFWCETLTLDGYDAELCGGVTSSVQLSHLNLSGLKLPMGAWQHMFPAGRQLPLLPVFNVRFDHAPGAGMLDRHQLEHMVACCPAVTRLSFGNLLAFKPSMSLAPLRLLRQLQDLECPHVMDGADSVGVLACMSSLTRLHVGASPGLSDDGLLKLTALTGLQQLGVRGTSEGDSCLTIMGRGDSQWTLKATSGRHPDVWYQLLLACAATAGCQMALNDQAYGIELQLQDSGRCTTTFELAREIYRAQEREAEARRALSWAKEGVYSAQQKLANQLEAERQPIAGDLSTYLHTHWHTSYSDADYSD